MSWKKSTIGDVLSVIKNGINCEQNKIPVGEKITRIETIAKKNFDFQRVGYANLTESEKERSQLKVGDILFSHINSPIHVGKTALYEGEEDIYHGINLLLMRTNEDVNPNFFNHFLNHLFVTGYWEKNCKKSVNQASVNQKDISKVEFNYPSLSTQHTIVNKLDAIITEIDKATAAAETNAKNADALFQSYLTEIFKRGGNDWTLDTLGNYYDVRDGTHDSPKFYDDGYPLVTSKNLKNGQISFEKIQFVSEEDYVSISQRSGVKKGDVLMAMIGTIGNPVVIETDTKFAIKNVALFKTKDKQSPHFLRYYLGSDYVINKMEKDAKGATQKFVGLGYLRSFPIKTPSFENQLAVVSELNLYEQQTKNLLNAYKNKIKNLEALKQSTLQQAFEGELVEE